MQCGTHNPKVTGCWTRAFVADSVWSMNTNSPRDEKVRLGRPWSVAGPALVALISFATVLGAQDSPALLNDAVSEFAAGRIEVSLERFDRLVEVDPDGMPYLWQRGIALYYAERWDDCRAQFEAHRAVNPNDVENAVWHFLCVARQETPARAQELLLPVGHDLRVPMGEIYHLYRGVSSPKAVLEVGAAGIETCDFRRV